MTYCVDLGEYEFESEGDRNDFLSNPRFNFDFNVENVDDKDGVERIFGSLDVAPEFAENPPRFTVTHIEASEDDPAVAAVSVELEMFFDIHVSLEEFLEWVEGEGETWRYSGRIECAGEAGMLSSKREEYESYEVADAGKVTEHFASNETAAGVDEFKINAGWERSGDGAICRWIIVWQELPEGQLAGAIGGYSGGGSFQVEQFYAKQLNGKLTNLFIDLEDKITGAAIEYWVDVPSDISQISDDAQDVIFEWNDRDEWEDSDQLILLEGKRRALREERDMLLLGLDYTSFAKDILASIGITAAPVDGGGKGAVDSSAQMVSDQSVDQSLEQDPLGSVREDIQSIEDKLYERGFLVSATGDQEADVSISFGEWGEGGERGFYWIIAITSDVSDEGDDEKWEELSDYVNDKLSDFADEWPGSVTSFMEDSFGTIILLNGNQVY